MPYLPIDHEEKTSGGQPVGQTGVATGGVGGVGGSGPQGGAKTNNSYTNLTNYLQANAGNNQTANDVKASIFDPLAASVTQNITTPDEAKGAQDKLHSAVQAVQGNTGGTQAAIQQTYGNTYTNQGNKALDSALSYRDIADQARASEKGANDTLAAWSAPKPEAPPSVGVSGAPNQGTAEGRPTATGATEGSDTVAGRDNAWTDPNKPPTTTTSGGRQPVWFSPFASTPSSGGAGHSMPGSYAHGGQIPEGGHFEKLMNKIKGKC